MTTAARPHVVHVIDELPPDGAERLLADILHHRSAAYRFSVVCLIRGGELAREIEAMGVPVVVLGRRRTYSPALLWRLIRFLRRERADVVHTHLFTADAYGRVAARLAGVPGVYSTVHSTNVWKGALHRRIDWLLAWLSTKVIAVSAEVAQVLRERDSIPGARIAVVENGIDLQRFAAATGEGVRAEFGLPEGVPLIGLVGRLHPAKGHADLVAVMAQLAAEGVAANCLLIGSGELHDEIAAEVERRGLRGRVTFTGQRTDIPRLLAALDVLAMPSRWEGLPMTLLEAMAMGKAIVATRVGGIPDVIMDGREGLLVPPGDVAALASALRRVITDAPLRRGLGDRARETLLARYDVGRTARAYESLYAARLGLPAGGYPMAEGATK
jgi:glycosyltransferase involved in cell wall biosynthesis